MKRTAIYISLLTLSVLSCTKKAELQVSRWNGEGERPSLSNKGLESSSQQSAMGEKVVFHKQYAGKYLIENAYAKTIETEKKGYVFQSYSILPKVKKELIKEADALESTKDSSWNNFKKQNPEYSLWKVTRSSQVVINTNNAPQAVYRVELSSPSAGDYMIHYTKSGAIYQTEKLGTNLSEIETSSAYAYPKGPKRSTLSTVSISRLLKVDTLENDKVVINAQSPLKVSSTDSLEVNPSDEKFDQIQAFYFANQIIDWFISNNIVEKPFKVEVLTPYGYPDKTSAAFYLHGQIKIGAGDDQAFSRMPLDPTIVMHETSHAVIDALAQLPSRGEGGSLNEGFADTFTTLFLNTPHLGESSYLLGPYKRSVETIVNFNERNDGVYHDSAVVSNYFWTLQKSVSADKVLKLAVRTLSRLNPSSDFAEFALTLKEQTAANLSGADLEKANQLMRVRGFP